MISILVPTYNYSVLQLVTEIQRQAEETGKKYEIIVLDDGSKNETTNFQNQKINSLPNSSFEELPQNIGRSAIRNLLARKASYNWLLFLDADVFPKQKNFISQYLEYLNTDNEIIYGGIDYQQEKPSPNEILRWKYGKEREAIPAIKRNKHPYISFLTLNFLIKKNVFDKIIFNEKIPNLRLEDTLFSYNLKEQKVKILHIDNPVYHLGLESSEIFLRKSLESAKAAYFLEKENLIPSEYIRILNFYKKMERLRLISPIFNFGKKLQPIMKKNLLSSNPNLKILDFYRFLHLYKIKNA